MTNNTNKIKQDTFFIRFDTFATYGIHDITVDDFSQAVDVMFEQAAVAFDGTSQEADDFLVKLEEHMYTIQNKATVNDMLNAFIDLREDVRDFGATLAEMEAK